MLVLDTSALIAALAGRRNDDLLGRLHGDRDFHVPHLIDVEFLHSLRRLVRRGDLTEDRAADARTDFADFALVRYPHHPLSERIWELRHNLTAYDAVFVALAEGLRAPLVTCDRSLAESPGHAAAIELFG